MREEVLNTNALVVTIVLFEIRDDDMIGWKKYNIGHALLSVSIWNLFVDQKKRLILKVGKNINVSNK